MGCDWLYRSWTASCNRWLSSTPDLPDNYLVGIECDDPTYRSAATACDRDKSQGAMLEALGWKLIRIWSLDWWVDKQGSLEKLHTQITKILNSSR